MATRENLTDTQMGALNCVSCREAKLQVTVKPEARPQEHLGKRKSWLLHHRAQTGAVGDLARRSLLMFRSPGAKEFVEPAKEHKCRRAVSGEVLGSYCASKW